MVIFRHLVGAGAGGREGATEVGERLVSLVALIDGAHEGSVGTFSDLSSYEDQLHPRSFDHVTVRSRLG